MISSFISLGLVICRCCNSKADRFPVAQEHPAPAVGRLVAMHGLERDLLLPSVIVSL
jgi:hypothetical protein